MQVLLNPRKERKRGKKDRWRRRDRWEERGQYLPLIESPRGLCSSYAMKIIADLTWMYILSRAHTDRDISGLELGKILNREV